MGEATPKDGFVTSTDAAPETEAELELLRKEMVAVSEQLQDATRRATAAEEKAAAGATRGKSIGHRAQLVEDKVEKLRSSNQTPAVDAAPVMPMSARLRQDCVA